MEKHCFPAVAELQLLTTSTSISNTESCSSAISQRLGTPYSWNMDCYLLFSLPPNFSSLDILRQSILIAAEFWEWSFQQIWEEKVGEGWHKTSCNDYLLALSIKYDRIIKTLTFDSYSTDSPPPPPQNFYNSLWNKAICKFQTQALKCKFWNRNLKLWKA